jgi:hypothetical protein
MYARALYRARAEREAEFRVEWRATKLTHKVENLATHKIRFAGQTDSTALGNKKYNPYPSIKELRKVCSTVVSEPDSEIMFSHACTLEMQGVWTTWFEHTNPLDFSWKTLIFGPGKRIISFLLNASINSLPSKFLLNLTANLLASAS